MSIARIGAVNSRSLTAAIVCATIGLSLLAPGYSQTQKPPSAESDAAAHTSGANFPTEQDVRGSIKIGATRKNIVERFGEPFDNSPLPDGTSRADYAFGTGNEAGNWKNRFSGFTVFYKNDAVIDWSPVYSTQTSYVPVQSTTNHGVGSVTVPAPKTAAPGSSSNTLSLFLVSENVLQDGIYVDTPAFPKLGYITKIPAMSIHQLKGLTEMTTPANAEKSIEAIEVRLGDNDARILKDISTRNIGEVLLIEINQTPVLAPRLQAPIESGEFQITGSDAKILHSMYESMRTMVIPADK